MKDKKIRKLIKILFFLILITIAIALIFTGRHYFTRRGIRDIEKTINLYGNYSPLIIVALIFLSNAIPPLPIPIPLVEMASGWIFGFGIGFLLSWFSQIISALFLFFISRYIGRNFIKHLLDKPIFYFYREYIHKKGAIGVLIIRATMANPFNVISFLSGFYQMNPVSFASATILGSLPEAMIFAAVGQYAKSAKFMLWYVLIGVIIISLVGPVIMFNLLKFLQGNLHPDVKKKIKKGPLSPLFIK